MVDLEQYVHTKWKPKNYNRYISEGYVFTKMNDDIVVMAKHLPNTSKEVIKATCDYCGKKYETHYCTIVNQIKCACGKCSPYKANELRKERCVNKYFTTLRQICNENEYTLITSEEEYDGVHMMVEFECKKHGVQKMMLDNLLRGHKCIKCSYESRFDNIRYNIDDVARNIESINGNKLLNPQDYKNVFMLNLQIQCSCGRVFITSYTNYTRANKNRCDYCTNRESSGEKIIHEYLLDNNIEFEREKRFNDCKDKKPLPFDFYLPAYNMCIEFDGMQHYKPVFSNNGFKKTQQHDIIKNEYCNEKGIHLLRIPFYNASKINSIIENSIKNIQVKDIV